jgi:hypothetical protein
MTQVSHNIFDALLSYRPRADRTSKENFLTEAFAHTLRSNPEICCAWLSELSGKPRDAFRGPFEVKTQAHSVAPGGKFRAVLDMTVKCNLAAGGEMKVLFEHKWESPADCDQLDRYVKVAAGHPEAVVVFIAPRGTQVEKVRHHIAHHRITTLKAFHWYDVQRFLLGTGDTGRVREFADFLLQQGLCEGLCSSLSVSCPNTVQGAIGVCDLAGSSCAGPPGPFECELQRAIPKGQNRKRGR